MLSTARTRSKALRVADRQCARPHRSPSSASAANGNRGAVALPDNGDVSINHADPDGTSVSFSYTDFLTPPSLIWSDDDGGDTGNRQIAAGAFRCLALSSPSSSRRRRRTARMVPYFVVRREGFGRRPAPTLLYGYGGFEMSMTPWYSGLRGRAVAGAGRCLGARQHPRRRRVRPGLAPGGAEGEPAARLRRFRRRRRGSGRARPDHDRKQLGIMGGSNGGLLTGVHADAAPRAVRRGRSARCRCSTCCATR